MKRGWPIAMLLLPALLALAALRGAASGLTPTPPADSSSHAASASPTGAPPAQGKLESYLSYLWPIIMGFVSGIAGVIVAIFTLTNKSIQLIKDRGHFWDTREPGPFEAVLMILLIRNNSDVLRTIRAHGNFVTEDKLNDRVGTVEEILRKESEERKNFERALMMHGITNKMYGGRKPKGGRG